MDDARSEEACPACGAHRLALLHFPAGAPTDEQASAAVIGSWQAADSEAPAIGCLECGAQWPDLASFRAAAESEPRAR